MGARAPVAHALRPPLHTHTASYQTIITEYVFFHLMHHLSFFFLSKHFPDLFLSTFFSHIPSPTTKDTLSDNNGAVPWSGDGDGEGEEGGEAKCVIS